MAEDKNLFEFEIPVSEFDATLLPAKARRPGTPQFEAAVKDFYEQQLRKVADTYTVDVDQERIRVTWRKDSLQPDPLDEAVALLTKGDYARGVEILEILLPSRETDARVHYNLGMAYSDLGRLEEAVRHLRRAVALNSKYVNAKVALGVAYARQKKNNEAAAVLKEAALDDPDNGYAMRNLGAVLMALGQHAEAAGYLQRAAEILPDDQQSWLGLGQAQLETGDVGSADESLLKAVEIQPYSQFAEIAKQLRSRIAQEGFRRTGGSDLRMDAVMYCLAALNKFERMTQEQVKNVGFEIAMLGMNGINVNDPASRYGLRTLPGTFSGLQLLCYEYVAFKTFAPEMDIGFDVAREYDEALRMKELGL